MTNHNTSNAPRRLGVPDLSTAAACLVGGVVLATSLAGPASATEPRPGPHTGSAHGTAPYAEPLDALGGLTLGQYLAAHRSVNAPV